MSLSDVLTFWVAIRQRGRRDAGRWFRDQWQRALGVSGVVFTVSAAAYVWWFGWREAVSSLAFPCFTLAAVVVMGLGVLLFETWAAPARVDAEHRATLQEALAERDRLRELRQPKVRMFFDASSPSCVHPMPPEHAVGHGGILYRVGVRNESDVEVTNLAMRVYASMPGATGLPAALHRMNDVSQPTRTHFNINPHSIEHFDVLLVPYALNARVMEQLNTFAPHMQICFADPVTPWVPAETCTLRLVAEGSNTTPIEGVLHFTREPTPEGEPLRYSLRLERSSPCASRHRSSTNLDGPTDSAE